VADGPGPEEHRPQGYPARHPAPLPHQTRLTTALLLQLSRATCGRADSLLASSSASAAPPLFFVHFRGV
jgi:hypothetical protein